MKRILVTGANGFVGRRLCGFLEQSFSVRATVRNANSIQDRISYECVQVGDLNSGTDWEAALKDIDCIVHLAARVHVMNEVADNPLEEFRQVNLHGTMNLARQAVKAGVKRFIYISTIKVNGESTTYRRCFSSDDHPDPVDPYAISKFEAEQQLKSLSDESGMEIVIIRPPLVYGEGVKGNFLKLIRLVDKGVPLPFGAVRNQRSMVSLDNLVDFISSCVTNQNVAGKVFLVSDNNDFSTPELIRSIAKHLNRPARLFSIPTGLINLVGLLSGQSAALDRILGSLCIDMSNIKTLAGWEPLGTPDAGIKQAVDWYLENK